MTDESKQPLEEAVARVANIAALARLDVTPDEARALGAQFARTLAQFEGLARLEVGDDEASGDSRGTSHVLRPDEPEPSLEPDRILKNAPERVDDFYRVPKTVGGEP